LLRPLGVGGFWSGGLKFFCALLVLLAAAGCAPPAVTCRPTMSDGSTPPGEQPSSGYYGNGSIWTALWPDGVVVADPDQVDSSGAIHMKFPWWRGPSISGKMEIEGRRLDASAPPLIADVPEGYGLTGFQASALIFASPGCWQVEAHVGSATLQFVTLVRAR
jgi:hypothetical protein